MFIRQAVRECCEIMQLNTYIMPIARLNIFNVFQAVSGKINEQPSWRSVSVNHLELQRQMRQTLEYLETQQLLLRRPVNGVSF